MDRRRNSGPATARGPGAQILDLPDLSSVHVMSHIDESDRGQLKAGQTATVRVEAVPDRDYQATVSTSPSWRASILIRLAAGEELRSHPAITDADARLRPGMSAVRASRWAHPDMLLVPSGAVFPAEGRLIVYRRAARRFDAVRSRSSRRGRDQVAVKGRSPPGRSRGTVKPPGDQAAGGAAMTGRRPRRLDGVVRSRWRRPVPGRPPGRRRGSGQRTRRSRRRG